MIPFRLHALPRLHPSPERSQHLFLLLGTLLTESTSCGILPMCKGKSGNRPDQFLRLFSRVGAWERLQADFTHIALGVWGRLLGVNAGMGHFNDKLQLPGLLFNFSCQEQRGLRDDLLKNKPKSFHECFPQQWLWSRARNCCDTYIAMEFVEGVDHIKLVHIYYSSVDG